MIAEFVDDLLLYIHVISQRLVCLILVGLVRCFEITETLCNFCIEMFLIGFLGILILLLVQLLSESFVYQRLVRTQHRIVIHRRYCIWANS